MTFGIETDYEHVDGIETVTHTEQPAGTATVTVKAHREALSFRETGLNSPAGIEDTDQAWVVWADTLRSGAVVSQGDTITDSASVVWTVLNVGVGQHDRIGSTVIKYRCICRKQT